LLESAQIRMYRLLTVIANNRNRYFARIVKEVVKSKSQLFHAAHRFAIELHDNVARCHPSLISGAPASDLGDQHTLPLLDAEKSRQLGREVVAGNSQGDVSRSVRGRNLLHARNAYFGNLEVE